ncbi:hypothetical protein E4H04_05750 [Candidatus Bathyarchaeota archaeon]|nr:MAG: hypothetical protein E4H04_05750 [Candidatus Bathyarchaeota archaeon]
MNRVWAVAVIAVLFVSMDTVPVYSQQVQLPYVEKPSVVVDGVVSDGEYLVTFTDPTTGIDVSWVHNGSLLYVALSGDNMGWLSIGVGSTNARMDGSNIIIGSVNEDGSHVVDEVGVGHNHYQDTSRGGESNIIEAGGKISDRTTIEFVIPLDSGDQLDYKLSPGETFGVFLALNNVNDDFSKIHSFFSETYIFYIEAVPNKPPPSMIGLNYLLLILVLIPMAAYLYWRMNRPKVYRFSEMNT